MTIRKKESIIQDVERYGVVMFVSFSVGNTGPFKEVTGITTLAENLKKEFLRENTYEVSGRNYNKISYIYGANGSGKTNYLVALTKMQKMIVMSTVLGTNNNKILEVPAIKKELAAPIETFKFDIDCKSRETYFEIQVIIDEILYTYSFAIQDGKIQKELLTKKKKRTEVLIKRTSPKYEDIVLRSALSTFKNMVSVVREDALCLAMAAMLNHTLASMILNEIMNYRVINMASVGNAPDFNEGNTNEEAIGRYLKYLKIADPTLTNLRVDLKSKMDKHVLNEDDLDNKELVIKNIHVSVQSLHATYKDYKQIGEIELPFLKYESNGTIRMLRVLPAVFEALDNGSTLFIDEIENGLHPNLVKLLTCLFNSEESNPHHAQLICTTHDTLLLNGVRRDQVWFADKNQYGETIMCRLSDYPNVRSNDNIAVKYLQGAFGAIPNTQKL